MNLYQPFLDYALTQLEQELELQPYPIPSGFEHKVAMTGKGKKEQFNPAFRRDELETDDDMLLSLRRRIDPWSSLQE